MSKKLTDTSIAQIAKCLQVAILTGTDVVDNLRQLEFVIVGDNIDISPEHLETFQKNLQKLLVSAKEKQTKETPGIIS